MIQSFLIFFGLFWVITPCAFHSSRHSTVIRNAKEMPNDLNTAHEVILVQSTAIETLSCERDKLKKENDELNAYIKRMLYGKRREKYINPD